MNWLRRIPPYIPWLLAGLITLGIGLYFRLYPFYRNVSSDAYEKSTMIVLARIRESVAVQVERQHPDLPPAQKEYLIKTYFNEVLRKDNAKVRQAYDQLGLKLLQQSGENKHYLLASDSYYFLSLTQNILEKGDISPKIEGSQYFNDMMLAPLGFWQPQTWHPYIGAYVYKIVKFFNPKADVMYGVGFTPLFLLPFVIAAFLFACRSMGCSWFPSFIASVFFVLAPIYLKRSTYAWYDDDTYTVLFPLLATGFLFYALRFLADRKKTIFYGLLCAASLALYTRFWYGWGFLLIVLMSGLGAILIKNFIFREKRAKALLGISLGLLIATLVGVLVMYGLKQVIEIFSAAAGELQKFIAPKFKDWPDLFIVVGELKKGTFKDIITLGGGPIVFFGALLTLAMATLNTIRRKLLPDTVTLLTVYLMITLVLGLSAQRFTILCVIPLTLLFALTLEALWAKREIIATKIKLTSIQHKKVLGTIIALVMLLSLIFPLEASQQGIRQLLNPIFNSAWDRALTKIRDQTPDNSVVDSWWAPGHFIKAIAKRRVIFDGATIRGDVAYWLTKAYLSQSEEEALGILRMMNTSSNSAAEYLIDKGLPLSRVMPILTEALTMTKERANTFYTSAFSTRDATALLPLTHGTPPPSYFMIYNEVVDGNVLLAYLGKWSFQKIEALNSNPEALKKVPSKSSKNYIDFLWSLVGGPFRQSEPLSLAGRDGTKIMFDQGVLVDTSDMSVRINSPQYGMGIPKSIFYVDGETVREKTFENSTLSFSVLFVNNTTHGQRCVLMERMLANSLLMRLYYFEGKGLKHFKPFAQESDITGRTKIYIYEILWPKEFQNH